MMANLLKNLKIFSNRFFKLYQVNTNSYILKNYRNAGLCLYDIFVNFIKSNKELPLFNNVNRTLLCLLHSNNSLQKYFMSNKLKLTIQKIKYRPMPIHTRANLIKSVKFYNYDKTNSKFWLVPISLGFSIFGFTDDKKEDDVTSMIKLAVLSIQREELPKAEQLLHVALKSAQEKDNTNAVTYIYDLMANLAMQRNELKKAENLFVEVLKRFLQRGISADDNAVVEVSLKLASIYANLGELQKANEGFNFCIGTQETKLSTIGEENVDEDTLVLWAMSQDWYARFLLSIGKYENAKAHFLHSYDVCVKVLGPEDSQTAVLLNDLGSVSSLLNKYDDAIEYLQKAIEIGKKSKSDDLCSFYINLGTVYMQKGLSKDAGNFCNLGLKLAEKLKNTDAINEGASCLDNIKGLQTA